MKKGLLIMDSSLVEIHEDVMFQKISAAAGEMANLFGEYGCELAITRKWRNVQDRITSNTRLPITFGYECWICCDVIRNGVILKIPAHDEVDYYLCSTCFVTFMVTKSFFVPKPVINYDFSETLDELRGYLKALQEENV